MLRIPAALALGLGLSLATAPLSAQSVQWTTLGFGTAGQTGLPLLTGTNLQYGRPLVLTLTNARPASPAFFVVGLSAGNTPVFGSTFVPSNDASLFVPVGTGGTARLRLVIPDLCPAVPLTLYAQCLIVDAANPTGAALSNAIRATIRDNVPSDFNGDGYSDLAIGVAGEDVNSNVDAGAVNVAYGGPTGITNAGAELIREGEMLNGSALLGTAEADDAFGSAIATGDFDGDGYDDLAIGAYGEDTPNGSVLDSGKVHIVYGSAVGLQGGQPVGREDQVFRMGAGLPGPAQAFSYLGKSLCAGDFNGDGFDDLAVGAPFYDETLFNDGVVFVLFGSATGLVSSGNLKITEPLNPESDDRFGWELEAGDWNGDGFCDIAVGRPYEDLGTAQDTGAVSVLYMGPTGVVSTRDIHMNTAISGVPIEGTATAFDLYGFALANGDFNGDGTDDLAIGIPYYDIDLPSLISAAGGVNVLHGAVDFGLVATGNQLWTQDSTGVQDSAALGDTFGYALTAGDFDYDGFCDLAIGVPGENFGGVNDTGAVNVLYGSGAGITATLDQLWQQNSLGVNSNGADDAFGFALWCGRIDGDCGFDLVFGIPGETVNGNDAGAVEVFYWFNSPTAEWSQAPLSGAPQNGDRFGGALAGSPDQEPW
ncbi:MAG: FG-GAP repeat protein [Planctomycetes bacterium]|nr:FG-GAP repeat protein [Planctomycetota bacterium]